MDQTAMYFSMHTKWTLSEQGAQTIFIRKAKDDSKILRLNSLSPHLGCNYRYVLFQEFVFCCLFLFTTLQLILSNYYFSTTKWQGGERTALPQFYCSTRTIVYMSEKCLDGWTGNAYVGWRNFETIHWHGTRQHCSHYFLGFVPLPHDGICRSRNWGVGLRSNAYPWRMYLCAAACGCWVQQTT